MQEKIIAEACEWKRDRRGGDGERIILTSQLLRTERKQNKIKPNNRLCKR